MAEALPGTTATGVIDPVEHGPDSGRGIIAREGDLGHVALMDGDLVGMGPREVGHQGFGTRKCRIIRFRNRRGFKVELHVVGENIAELSPLLGVHEPKVPSLEFLNLVAVRQPGRVRHCLLRSSMLPERVANHATGDPITGSFRAPPWPRADRDSGSSSGGRTVRTSLLLRRPPARARSQRSSPANRTDPPDRG